MLSRPVVAREPSPFGEFGNLVVSSGALPRAFAGPGGVQVRLGGRARLRRRGAGRVEIARLGALRLCLCCWRPRF